MLLRSAAIVALDKKRGSEDVLWSAPPRRKLVLISKIVECEPGDAFKRWLLPGWGSTVVSVESELRDANQLGGTVRARRTVSFGGAYTIGAWRTICASIAGIVSDLRDKVSGGRAQHGAQSVFDRCGVFPHALVRNWLLYADALQASDLR
jgi:hypothetical protein